MAILSLTRKFPHLAINKCNEVHGACRHKPRFHRFDQPQTEVDNSSADESMKDERVTSPTNYTSSESPHSTASTGSARIDRRESETFTLLPDGPNRFGFDVNRENGLIARSEWLKQDELDIDSDLEEKLPPQEYEGSSYGDSPGGWDLVGAVDEDSF